MRVLWVDADGSPWTETSGWQVLEDFGLVVNRVPSVVEGRALLEKREFELLLVRAELSGAPGFLVHARKFLAQDQQRIVLASSDWSKEQFKIHSKTDGAAHRYARIPMPPEGFLSLVADLFDCTVEELAGFTLTNSSSPVSAPSRASPPPPKPQRKAPPMETSGADADVLRKYLRIKEEQLEISDGEREELAIENERLQREAHQLQMRVRELEHLHDEITKKLVQMDEEKQTLAAESQLRSEESDRNERSMNERIRSLEGQLGESGEKYENLRVRVRKDIRKIRENERELEARLELLRRDSATLLQARDEKVLEMQRKIDALEFDLDQVQDSRVQAQMEAERYLAKLSRVARALHIATGMIEEDNTSEEELDELEPLMGGAANAQEVKAEAQTLTATGEGTNGGGPAGAEPPPAEENHGALTDSLEALAASGDATQMIDSADLNNMGGEPESNSG